MAARGECSRAGQDSEPEPESEPGPEPESEPGPEPEPQAGLETGEEFEIVDRSQLPSPGELRSTSRPRAADSWSAPILTLARRATGNLSASCGSALRAAAGLGDSGGGGGGGERAGRPGSRGLGLLPGWGCSRLGQPDCPAGRAAPPSRAARRGALQVV